MGVARPISLVAYWGGKIWYKSVTGRLYRPFLTLVPSDITISPSVPAVLELSLGKQDAMYLGFRDRSLFVPISRRTIWFLLKFRPESSEHPPRTPEASESLHTL